MRVTPSVALFLAITLSACQPAGEQTEADVAAIQALAEEWTAAFNTGDVAGVVAWYTDDAVQMPPNEPANTGPEAIGAWLQAIFAEYSGHPGDRIVLGLSSQEIQVAGDWAFDRGTYEWTVTPLADGEAIQESGKYIVIWQRQPDGSWKMAREIWNSNTPPPGME